MKTNANHINDELLVKHLLGEALPEESEAVIQWIAASDANKKYFDNFKLIWDTGKEIASKSTIDENAAWLRFKKMATETEQTKTSTPVIPITKKFPLLRIAAAFFAVALGSIAFYYYKQSNKTNTPINIIAGNKVVADTLPDGSVVTMNKNATLSYASNFNDKDRTIQLSGEAFFKVTPNKKKPFIINVNDVRVTVVGTSFNIKTVGNKTEVIVATGVVQVEHTGKTIELHPYEKTVVSAQTDTMQKENTQDKLYNYYTGKEFICDHTPLQRLTEVLNDAYNVDIVIEKDSLKNLQLTTTFNNESLDNILTVIAQTLDVKIEKSGNKIILK